MQLEHDQKPLQEQLHILQVFGLFITRSFNQFPVREINIPFIVKLGFTGVYIFFLFLIENIDCGLYMLELPGRGGSNIYPLSIF